MPFSPRVICRTNYAGEGLESILESAVRQIRQEQCSADGLSGDEYQRSE